MPPVVLWVAGTVGVVALTRFVIRESRRINAELHPERYGDAAAQQASGTGRLRRDASGVYRPE